MSSPPPIGASPAVNLALQGGGSHGAFTWGVLDRLLEDPTLTLGAVSGTSAGALNGAVLASGLHHGGREGARTALREFWLDVSRSGSVFHSIGQGGAAGQGFNFDKLPAYQWMNTFFNAVSPYEFNPLNLNPLREVAMRHVDVAALQTGAMPLFITATHVPTGQARIFDGRELSIDALLASACLPFMFQAVEIDGEPYWDGGYTGNPALQPLMHGTEAQDLLLVKINPLHRADKPVRSVEIVDRVSEITFNASLIAEMRAIAFISRLVREGKLDPVHHKVPRLHMVADEEGLAPFKASSKFNTDRAFLETLFGLGRAAADRWLARHRADIGVRSSLDVERVFLSSHEPSPGHAANGKASAPSSQARHPAGVLTRLWQRGTQWLRGQDSGEGR